MKHLIRQVRLQTRTRLQKLGGLRSAEMTPSAKGGQGGKRQTKAPCKRCESVVKALRKRLFG